MQGSFLDIKSSSTRLALLFSILLVLTLFLAAALPPISSATQGHSQSGSSQKRSRPEFVPGQALVRYRSERLAKQKTFQTLVTAEGRQLSIQLERFDGADIVPGLRLAHVAPEDTMAAIAALNEQPDVLYAEPNYILHLDLTPNDPSFPQLYGLTKIGAPTAWNTTTGVNTGPNAVVVGVIDEGIDKLHQDLAANIWTNPAEIAGNGVDDDGNGFIDDVNGYNFADNTGTIPGEQHASHVAGTIGAVGNNGVGVVGVNWQVRLMSLKFIGGSAGATSDAIRASNYAKQMHDLWISSGGTKGANIRVLNNSYGGGSFSQSFLDAILGLNQSGVLFVAAAGNDALDNDLNPHFPANYDAPNVVSVAATDSIDGLASFSDFGAQTVHLGAPGVSILSTTPGNTYTSFSGTSMATPHVAGAAALLLAQNPNLTVQQLRSLLIFNGDPVTSLNGKTLTGRRLNIANSFQARAENDTTAPGTVTSFHLNTQNGRALNVGWTNSGDDGAVGQASLYQLSFTDGTTGTVLNLKNVVPGASGVIQALDVKLPYRHTSGTLTLREFDNVGNEGVPATLAVSVSLVAGDPYLPSLGSAVALSAGGTPLALIGDDSLKLNYALPFAFPFFGQNFSTVNISTNGNLFFSAPPTRTNGDADDVPSSSVGLTQFKMISGLWDDLRTDRRVGDDVYVTSDMSHIIFRWSGVTFGDGTPATEFPVNFEIELRSDGTIFTRYGAGQSAPTNTNLFPVVGIGGGEPEAYVIPSHTSEAVLKSLTNAQEVTFLPRGLTNALTVASTNPATGVSITVSPNDGLGLGNGTTQFTRNYLPSTVVNLTAPAFAGNNRFQKWQKDGVDFSINPATSLTMDAAHTMTAVYVTPRALTVASSNPSSGVSITVSPNDIGGFGNGNTQFTRTYDDSTNVSLTAPATSGGNNFQKWQRDGVDVTTNAVTNVTMDAAHTMTAVYVTPRTLTVASLNPNSAVGITVSPNDNNSLGNGATQFTRTYAQGSVVNLTAPATAGGNIFQKWQRDSVDFSTTAATSVTIDSNRTLTAVYVAPQILTVASVNPASGLSITVSPNDGLGLGNGTTQFTRNYDNAGTVNLTAAATAAGNSFLKWQRDGVDISTNAATSVTMDGDHTMTAVYANFVQFSLPQFDVMEAGLSAMITVTRSGSTATTASVDYVTSDVTATQKGDYTLAAGTLTFAAGESSKTFPILIIDDVFQEGTESFSVTLSNPIGTTLGPINVTTVRIFDNDLAPGTTNPLDNTNGQFFVRQHYLDFFTREPDAGGLAFWSNQISECENVPLPGGFTSAAQCREVRRINVSAAFFLSIEFQETGYLVERFYKSAYGDAIGTSTFNGAHTLPVPVIRYLEFLRDTQQIGKGVVVGQTGWETVLENNKVAYANDFVSRTRFTTAYPGTMTSAQFVDALNTNATNSGVPPLSQAERDSLVSQLTAGTKTRAQVVRAVAEDSDLNNSEKNKAFVLLQFIGYLRRDPNSGQDTDYTGYDFWLTKLNQFNGNFVNAEMVKAFLVSGEYRGRFGPQ